MSFDLHCDLLRYLELDDKFTPYDDISNCSINQLLKGNVKKQVLALFVPTEKGSTLSCQKQLKRFFSLPKLDNLQFFLAAENASCFFEENEPVQIGFERIEKVHEHILYLTMCWKHENRFGGGNCTNVGLKPDGKLLLKWLNKKNIAIDMSHTSDKLAFDIIDFLEKNNLQIRVIASHSNFRKECNHERNLPTDIAKYIIQKKGLIGLVLLKDFVGKSINNIIDHIEYGLSLSADNTLALGTDFFYKDLKEIKQTSNPYFDNFENSSCLTKLKEILLPSFPLNLVNKIFNINANNFFK